jgi:hypothetical protein
MNNSQLIIYNFAVNAGIQDYSLLITPAINGGLYTIPQEKNVLIKQINFFANCTNGNNAIKFWDFRILLLNKDNTIQQNLAGIIKNPISGNWGSAFVKDVNTDFVVSSRKSLLEFPQGFLAGGITPRSVSVFFDSPLAVTTQVRIQMYIQYEAI